MTDNKNIPLSALENVKKQVKDLLAKKDFEGYESFSEGFKKLSLSQKIEFLDWIKTVPSSTRKTLLFSAFLKKEKKKMSRDISLGFLL